MGFNNIVLSGYSLINSPKNKETYEYLYQPYIMKKYFGVTHNEARSIIKKTLDNSINSNGYKGIEALNLLSNDTNYHNISVHETKNVKNLLFNLADI
ncbi:hypothetical protein MIDIC_10017 [Alphaproteobacteria bacterium]